MIAAARTRDNFSPAQANDAAIGWQSSSKGQGCDMNDAKRSPAPRHCVISSSMSTGSVVEAVQASRPLLAAQRPSTVCTSYATDGVMADHVRRTTPEASPYLSTFLTMDMDERWVNRSPEAMLETFHWFRGEGFAMIVEDLLALPRNAGIIAEGFRLLPHLVKPLLAEPDHAVWLLPTPDFRRRVFDGRGPMFLEKTSDPHRALRNLLERDALFTDWLYEETKLLALPVIVVDTTLTEDDLAERIATTFGL
jgi:hypothetical protein